MVACLWQSQSHQSSQEESHRGDSAANGSGPVALAHRAGQTRRAGLDDGGLIEILASRNSATGNDETDRPRRFETARARRAHWAGNGPISEIGRARFLAVT